jgi:hypothetical protein
MKINLKPQQNNSTEVAFSNPHKVLSLVDSHDLLYSVYGPLWLSHGLFSLWLFAPFSTNVTIFEIAKIPSANLLCGTQSVLKMNGKNANNEFLSVLG